VSDPISRPNAALEGRYTIKRELGEGGMATVYLADDLKHERRVALKVLKPELAAVVGAERFLAGIKTTANLTHPHILPLHDSGAADGFLFYVMPFVEGESLRERIDREKQLGVDDALAITQKVTGALDYAHGNGVVHRDIKPANMVSPDGNLAAYTSNKSGTDEVVRPQLSRGETAGSHLPGWRRIPSLVPGRQHDLLLDAWDERFAQEPHWHKDRARSPLRRHLQRYPAHRDLQKLRLASSSRWGPAGDSAGCVAAGCRRCSR
jgi:hypothetical protein